MNDRSAPRWMFADDLAHVLADHDTGNSPSGRVTVCGIDVPATAIVYGVPPSLDVCRECVPLPGSRPPTAPLTVHPPTFGTPTVF